LRRGQEAPSVNAFIAAVCFFPWLPIYLRSWTPFTCVALRPKFKISAALSFNMLMLSPPPLLMFFSSPASYSYQRVPVRFAVFSCSLHQHRVYYRLCTFFQTKMAPSSSPTSNFVPSLTRSSLFTMRGTFPFWPITFVLHIRPPRSMFAPPFFVCEVMDCTPVPPFSPPPLPVSEF